MREQQGARLGKGASVTDAFVPLSQVESFKEENAREGADCREVTVDVRESDVRW